MGTEVKVVVAGNDLEQLVSQIEFAEQNLPGAKELFIDTSAYGSARPHVLTVLTAFMKEVAASYQDTEISTQLPDDENVKNYMARVKFYQENGFDVPYPFTERSSKGKFIEIKGFNEGNCLDVVEELTHIVREAGLVEGLQKALAFCFNEIMDNSCCHAKSSGEGIMSAQSFADRIEVAIVDRGIGIASSLKERDIYRNLDSRELLEHSIKEGVTSKPTEVNGRAHQGFGLFSVNQIAKMTGGSFHIYSFDARLETKGGYTKSFEAPSWQGTIIYFTLKKNLSPQKWEEIWKDVFWSRSFVEPLLAHIDVEDFF